jgi:SAM-dependent methyltransferase
MMECSKAVARRLHDPAFSRFYFVGHGIDIGGAPDPLSLYVELFPLLRSVRIWDMGDGDAQFMAGVPDETFDFVHSSHCLEHVNDPLETLRNWMRILKPSGHLVVMIPDEDLYEQGTFPSTFNPDHKCTLTILKSRSWSRRSINVLDLLQDVGADADIQYLKLLNASYRYGLPRIDQTMTPIGESAIEFVIRKRTAVEVAVGGRLPCPSPESGLPAMTSAR